MIYFKIFFCFVCDVCDFGFVCVVSKLFLFCVWRNNLKKKYNIGWLTQKFLYTEICTFSSNDYESKIENIYKKKLLFKEKLV